MTNFYKTIIIILLFLLCSCSITEDELDLENGMMFSGNTFQEDPKEFYAPFYEFEIPLFSKANTAKLPLYDSNTWCINDDSFKNDWQQIFIEDEIAIDLAYAIYLVDSFNFRLYDFNEFDCAENANNQYLLYAAISSTPKISLNYNYGYINGKAIASFSDPNNIVSKICEYAYEKYNFTPMEAYYFEDVKKTFHHLFGNNINFHPETIYNRCYRYIPEADIFLYFLDGPSIAKNSYPQIIDYKIEGNIYYVEAVLLSIFDYDKDKKLNPEITEKYILSLPKQSYVFEKDLSGHFIIKSIK